MENGNSPQSRSPAGTLAREFSISQGDFRAGSSNADLLGRRQLIGCGQFQLAALRCRDSHIATTAPEIRLRCMTPDAYGVFGGISRTSSNEETMAAAISFRLVIVLF